MATQAKLEYDNDDNLLRLPSIISALAQQQLDQVEKNYLLVTELSKH